MNNTFLREVEDFPESLAKGMLKALVIGTINDITHTQMNRIITTLQRLSGGERQAPVKVARILADEIGASKATTYVEKAHSEGLIPRRQYDEMRAALVLYSPREKLPAPWEEQRRALVQGQRQLRTSLQELGEVGREVVKAPFTALEKDVQRLKKVWGL